MGINVTEARQALGRIARSHGRFPGLAMAAAGVVVAWGTGISIGRGGSTAALIVVAAAAGALASFLLYLFRDRLHTVWGVEAPVVLLLISNQVFRLRTAADIASNPVDTAGAFRIACVAMAGLLGAFAFLSPREKSFRDRLTTVPFRVYAAYVVVVFIGAPISVDAPLTAYRGVELLAGLLVIAGAWNVAGHDAGRRIGTVLFWFVVGLLATVWVGVVVAPGHAVKHSLDRNVPIPISIQGAFPDLSANSVGSLGVILTVWSMARMSASNLAERLRPAIAVPLALVGAASLLAAQYRTGYAALIVALTAFLVLRRKWALLGTFVIVVAAVLISVPSILSRAEPYALRGATVQKAQDLNSRVRWWGQAIQVWEESPIVGRGLLTATRFEVFQPLGLDVTSTIHSTWVEALVGTGVLGITLLAAAFFVTFLRATKLAFRDRGQLVPFLLLLVLLVRSFTGSTFESFQEEALVLFWLMLTLRSRAERRDEPTIGGHDAGARTAPSISGTSSPSSRAARRRR